jgi:hypothetical protein
MAFASSARFRPIVREQELFCFATQAKLASARAGLPVEEESREGERVLFALPERESRSGSSSRKNRSSRKRLEAISEREIAVRRANDAHRLCEARFLRRAAPLLLERAQELSWNDGLTSAISSRKSVPAGALEASGMGGDGAGEGALRVRELAFENALGERFAVHGDEGTSDPVAAEVETPRHDLLPHSALTQDQDRRPRGGGAVHQVENRPHGIALGHDLRVATPENLSPKLAVLVPESPDLERPLHQAPQLVVVERFGDVVEGARAHGGDGGGNVPVCGDQNDGRRRPRRVNLPQELEPVETFHAPVGDDDVGGAGEDLVERFPPAGEDDALVAGTLERRGDGLRHLRLVVDHQDTGSHAASVAARGR